MELAMVHWQGLPVLVMAVVQLVQVQVWVLVQVQVRVLVQAQGG
jgi:hypothetical protein